MVANPPRLDNRFSACTKRSDIASGATTLGKLLQLDGIVVLSRNQVLPDGIYIVRDHKLVRARIVLDAVGDELRAGVSQ